MKTLPYHFSVQACTLLFGLSGIIGGEVTAGIMTVVLGRGLFAALALGLTMALRGTVPWNIPRGEGLRLLLNGALLGIHWFCFFMGVRTGGVAIGTLGFASFPAFVTLGEALLLRERPTRADLLTLLCITAGICVLGSGVTLSSGAGTGLMWALAAGLTHAAVVMFNRYIQTHASVLQSSWIQCVGCGLIALPGGLAGFTALSESDLILITLLGIACTGLAYTLMTYGLKGLNARTVSFIIALEPVYAILMTWILFSEPPGLRTTSGALLIVGGILLPPFHGGKKRLPRRKRSLLMSIRKK